MVTFQRRKLALNQEIIGWAMRYRGQVPARCGKVPHPGDGTPLFGDLIMRLKSFFRTTFVCTICAVPMAHVTAQTAAPSTMQTDIIQDTGVANRLTVGEVLRSLTQEIPAAVCHLQNQIDVDDAAGILAAGLDQVDELTGALLTGDIFWGIEATETRRKTIAEIEALQAEWAPIQAAGMRVLDDPSDQQAARIVYGAADILMDKTYRLLTTLDAQYSGSAEIQMRDVVLIQVAGRMAALHQRAALDACLLWSNGEDAEIAQDLATTMSHYENSLRALLDGLPAMGILPPRTPGIADKLAEVESYWARNKAVLETAVTGQAATVDVREVLYNHIIDEHVSLLDVIYLYQDHSKIH